MSDRAELLESAVNAFTEGVVLADMEGRIAFWNRAAEGLTGLSSAEIIGRRMRETLDALVVRGSREWIRATDPAISGDRGNLVRIRHMLNYELPVVSRVTVLRDALGTRVGTGVLFHPAESIDALPHGASSDDARVSESQALLEERLARMHEDFLSGDLPLGILWLTVDQAASMRQSHGSRACKAMLETVERAIAGGLKPTEEIGRWGSDEFLVLSHERTAASLVEHGRILAGLARTADFRWWGDRISLTVSIGAAQVEHRELLASLLERAQAAMLSSIRAGGNHVTAARGKA